MTVADSNEDEEQESPTIKIIKMQMMAARIEELESKLGVFKKKKHRQMSVHGMALDHQLYMTLPISLEIEEVILLGKQGSLFDETRTKEAVLHGFSNSRKIADDAVIKMGKQLENCTGYKVHIFTYEQARLDNSVHWERPENWIDLQVRGIVFLVWAGRLLSHTNDNQYDDLSRDDNPDYL